MNYGEASAADPIIRFDNHHGIHELVNYGLVELEANGQAKRPVLWYDEIEIGIPLTRLADASDDTVVA